MNIIGGSSNQTELEALRNIAEAAREVDGFFEDPITGTVRFRFDARQCSPEAELALLSLHDYLNDLERETA